jgi:hypothetical protein
MNFVSIIRMSIKEVLDDARWVNLLVLGHIRTIPIYKAVGRSGRRQTFHSRKSNPGHLILLEILIMYRLALIVFPAGSL